MKYSVSSRAIASGLIDSDIAVNPRMSLKSTVIGRFSPPSWHGGVLLRDLGGDIRREVALEVRADQSPPAGSARRSGCS